MDSPEAGAIEAALRTRGWSLTHILNTHYHSHVAPEKGLLSLFRRPCGRQPAAQGVAPSYIYVDYIGAVYIMPM